MEITEETGQDASFEDLVSDPTVKIMAHDLKKNTIELRSISELDEKKKEMVKELMASSVSISVSATKPAKC